MKNYEKNLNFEIQFGSEINYGKILTSYQVDLK